MGEEVSYAHESAYQSTENQNRRVENDPNRDFEREFRQIEQNNALEYLESETFHQKFIAARREHDQLRNGETAMKLAEVQVEYIDQLRTIAGHNNENFTNDEDLLLWNARVRRALFDTENPDSMASRASAQLGFSETEKQFVGSTNVLTFMNLWQEMYPDKAKVKMIVADPELDVKGKIDIAVMTKQTILMFQLKASYGNNVDVYPITDVNSPRGENVKEGDVKKMLGAAEVWRQQTGKYVQVLVAEVPGMGSESIRNVFGVPLKNKEQLVSNLKSKAENASVPLPVAA